MNNSLAKLELENKTRLLFFKHRGDLPAIIKELRDEYEDEVDNAGSRITVEYVEKIIKKFKREQKENDPFVATSIMNYVFMGTKQRELLWDADDQVLEGHRFFYLSGCCDAMTRLRVNDQGESYFMCLKCDKICNGYRQPDLRIFELQRKLRIEKRKDEDQLVKAIDSLGFGEGKPPTIHEHYNQVVISGDDRKQVNSKELKRLPAGDQKLIESMENMDARDRETVRKDLEKIKRKVVGDGWPK